MMIYIYNSVQFNFVRWLLEVYIPDVLTVVYDQRYDWVGSPEWGLFRLLILAGCMLECLVHVFFPGCVLCSSGEFVYLFFRFIPRNSFQNRIGTSNPSYWSW